MPPRLVPTLTMFVASLVLAEGYMAIMGTIYSKIRLCEYKKRIDNKCMVLESKQKRSTIYCAILCDRHKDTCVASVRDKNGYCYFHAATCPASDGGPKACTASEQTAYTTWSRDPYLICHNGGKYDPSILSCHCLQGFAGGWCEIALPTSCKDLRAAGYKDGQYKVKLDILGDYKPILVLCELDGGHANTYVSRSEGYADFNKSYNDYVNGFQYKDEFWLGLKYMSKINHDGAKKLVIRIRFLTMDIQAMYRQVALGDENDGYVINYNSVNVDGVNAGILTDEIRAEKCLPVGKGFSTFDHDKDDMIFDNVAERVLTGWWFSDDELPCNPNGKRYPSYPATEKPQNVRFEELNLHDSLYAKEFTNLDIFFQQLA